MYGGLYKSTSPPPPPSTRPASASVAAPMTRPHLRHADPAFYDPRALPQPPPPPPPPPQLPSYDPTTLGFDERYRQYANIQRSQPQQPSPHPFPHLKSIDTTPRPYTAPAHGADIGGVSGGGYYAYRPPSFTADFPMSASSQRISRPQHISQYFGPPSHTGQHGHVMASAHSPSPHTSALPGYPAPIAADVRTHSSPLMSRHIAEYDTANPAPVTSAWPRLVQTAPVAVSTPSSTSSSSSSSSSTYSTRTHSRTQTSGQYQTIIECGYIDDKGERQLTVYSPYFGKQIEVYSAVNDPTKSNLYRVSALAEKIGCATNKVGMYLARRRQVSAGIYQATQFRNKPPGRTGLKSGGYFLTQEACQEFEHHFRTKLVPNVARRSRKKSESGGEQTDDSGNELADVEGDDNVGDEPEMSPSFTKSPRPGKRKSGDIAAVKHERDVKREPIMAVPVGPYDESGATLVSVHGHTASYAAQMSQPLYSEAVPPTAMSGPLRHEHPYVTHQMPPPPHYPSQRYPQDIQISPQYGDSFIRRHPPPYQYPIHQPVISHERVSPYHPLAEVPHFTQEHAEVHPHYMQPFDAASAHPAPYDTAALTHTATQALLQWSGVDPQASTHSHR